MLGRSCKHSCNCEQLLTQLQSLSPTANAMSSHLTTATANATASRIKPTTASATANDMFQPGTAASTTATAGHQSSATATANAIGDFRPGTTASTTANNGLRQPQLQLQSQLHTPASQPHTTACNCLQLPILFYLIILMAFLFTSLWPTISFSSHCLALAISMSICKLNIFDY